MHIVFEDKDGRIHWREKIEVESLEKFAKERNRRVKQAGSNRDVCFVDPPRNVRVISAYDGKFEGKYHICDPELNRLTSN